MRAVKNTLGYAGAASRLPDGRGVIDLPVDEAILGLSPAPKNYRGGPHMRVYLAGSITGLTYAEATGWREDATRRLTQAGLSVLSPMRGKTFILKRLAGDEVLAQTYPDAPMSTQKGIVARDRFDVARADVVLFYLLEATQVSIGTMIEIGWCDAFRKLAVVVMQPEGNPHDHAFVKEIAGYVVPTLDDAIELLTVLAKED